MTVIDVPLVFDIVNSRCHKRENINVSVKNGAITLTKVGSGFSVVVHTEDGSSQSLLWTKLERASDALCAL